MLGERRGGHGGWIDDDQYIPRLALSPDGSLLASWSRGVMGICLWDARTLRLRTSIKEHARFVAFAPDGKTLAAAVDGQVRMWNLDQRTPLLERPFVKTEEAGWLDYSPDGKRLAVVSSNGTFTLWDLSKPEPRQQTTLKEVGNWAAAFSPDGKMLVTGGGDGIIRLCDVAGPDAKKLGEFKGHKLPVASLAFSADGKSLASGGLDGTVRLWELKDQGLIERRVLQVGNRVESVAWAPDGKTLACGCTSGQVHLWDLARERPAQKADFHAAEYPLSSLTFAKDGKALATVGREGIVRLWDLATPKPAEFYPPKGHRGAVNTIAFSPDGKRLASGGIDRTVRLWDLTGSAPKEQVVLAAHTGSVAAVRFAPDGKALASASNETILWDLQGSEPHGEPVFNQEFASDFTFNEKGQLAAIVAGYGSPIHIWDLTGEKPKQRYESKQQGGYYAFSPDGRCLASGFNVVPLVLDLAGPDVKEQALPEGSSNRSFAFSPDSKTLAGGADVGMVQLWDLKATPIRKKPNLTSDAPRLGRVFAVAFTPDGKKVFAADQFGRMVAWDLAFGFGQVITQKKTVGSETKVWQLPGAVYCLALSPDGRYLASGNADGSVYILHLDPSVSGMPTKAD